MHLGSFAGGVEGGGLARGVPQDQFAVEVRGVRQGEEGEAVGEIAVVAVLGAEEGGPGGRVHAVRADHQVVRALPPAVEGHVHAVRGRVEAGDGVAEEELHVVADQPVQGVGEVAPPYLQIAGLALVGGGSPEGR